MKNLALLIISIICLAGCSKTAPPGSTKIIAGTITAGTGDTVTIADNGVTYTYTNAVINNAIAASVSCELYKNPFNSTIELVAQPFQQISGADTEVLITIFAPGPLNSIGAYRVTPLDSSGSSLEFIELTGAGEINYLVDSMILNVFYAGGTTVIGNYEMWVTEQNFGTSKSVTGNFNFHRAQIQ